MAAVWILLIAVITFFTTISLVVVGQETHPLIAVVLFVGLIYGAVKLFQMRVTRL